MSPSLIGALVRIGYAPFHFTTSSDHRPILMDFDENRLFGTVPDRLQPHQERSFRVKDRKAVQKFIEIMYDEISLRQGFLQQQELDDDRASLQLVEEIDTMIGQCRDLAENKCRRRRPEFYSQPVVKQRVQVSILRAHLNALKMCKDRTPQLLNRMHRLGIEVDLPPTRRLTRSALQIARSRLQDIIKDHESSRQEELNQKIDQAETRGARQVAKVIRAIKTVEMGKRTYRILRAMRRPSGISQSIDRLEVPLSWPPPQQEAQDLHSLEDPKTCTQWRLVSDPAEIEYYLIMRNRIHFGQAQGTPFTCPPLSIDFDWEATSTESDNVLQGNYEFTTTFPHCRNLLEACKAVTAVDHLPHEFTP